jgi:putative endonuclease
MYVVETSIGKFYCGVSTNVERRIREHNTDRKKAAKACWPWRPVRLLRVWGPMNRSAALSKERSFKKLRRSEKIEIMEE